MAIHTECLSCTLCIYFGYKCVENFKLPTLTGQVLQMKTSQFRHCVGIDTSHFCK